MSDPAAGPDSPLLQAVDGLRERRRAWMGTSGMSVLLALLVFGIFVLPALVPEGSDHGIVTDILLTLILVSGVIAVAEHHRFAVALVALGLVVIVARWGAWILPFRVSALYREISTVAAILVLAVAVGINVFAGGRQLSDRIFGAIVLYLLIGLMWTLAYSAVEASTPGAFHGSKITDPSFFEWGYFSFVTLTTVGYGDITPVARVARSLANLEALIGQLYPAIIIARLVSLPH